MTMQWHNHVRRRTGAPTWYGGIPKAVLQSEAKGLVSQWWCIVQESGSGTQRARGSVQRPSGRRAGQGFFFPLLFCSCSPFRGMQNVFVFGMSSSRSAATPFAYRQGEAQRASLAGRYRVAILTTPLACRISLAISGTATWPREAGGQERA
ncbi:hypothetical protein GQ53DRAFT_451211 [Thozetella sp. PMI_491]|nr:hypothetical protein GQ53DRAFT_451211 [Thozetella sp. PMI_491]